MHHPTKEWDLQNQHKEQTTKIDILYRLFGRLVMDGLLCMTVEC